MWNHISSSAWKNYGEVYFYVHEAPGRTEVKGKNEDAEIHLLKKNRKK